MDINFSGSAFDPNGTVVDLGIFSGVAPLNVTFNYGDDRFDQSISTLVKTQLDTGEGVIVSNSAIAPIGLGSARTTYTTLQTKKAKTAATVSTHDYVTPGSYRGSLTVIYGTWAKVTYNFIVNVGSVESFKHQLKDVTIASSDVAILSFESSGSHIASLINIWDRDTWTRESFTVLPIIYLTYNPQTTSDDLLKTIRVDDSESLSSRITVNRISGSSIEDYGLTDVLFDAILTRTSASLPYDVNVVVGNNAPISGDESLIVQALNPLSVDSALTIVTSSVQQTIIIHGD